MRKKRTKTRENRKLDDMMPSNPNELYENGLGFHRRGDLLQAAECYLHVLEINPKHAGAWHFLGAVALARKDHATAMEHFEKALSFCDNKAVYWNNYGIALKELRRDADALAAFEKAVSLDSGYADAWSNLGFLD